MKIIDCIQGSAEWFSARCGIPTASRFCDIVTPTGKPVTGKARRTYLLELVGERLTKSVSDHYVSTAMMRGTELEPKARAWYELLTGKAVSQVGFVLSDCGRWGCSPDGITETGGIEIKCLLRVAHLDVLETGEIPSDYRMQMEGAMWILKRPTWDLVVFTDELGIPSRVLTLEQDPKIAAALEEHVAAFSGEVEELTRKIKEEA